MTAQTLANSAVNASALQPANADSWQQELKQAIRSGSELLAYLGLDKGLLAPAAESDFKCLVTRSYADRMQRDPADPLLRQVLPIAEETQAIAGFVKDPLEESAAQCAPGLLQKYKNRALLICTGACAIHCRYCFRRSYDYQQHDYAPDWWDQALQRVQEDQQIDELILSGGDPLLLPNAQLRKLIEAITAIPHIKRLRIHTRLPIVLPARIDNELIQILKQCAVPVFLVTHANHAQELSNEVRTVTRALHTAGIRLLNQSVLLRGVNDDADVIIQLSHALLESEIMPYYLHCLDHVQGTAHFEVDENTAQQIMKLVQASLPGYLVPRLVREVPGTDSKQLVGY